jgi:tetratricopeptide (TPR) repeat protein
MRSFRLILGLAAALALLCLGAVALWGLWSASRERAELPQSHDADPRIAYLGPYANVHPDVSYVGDAACAECHAEIAAAYKQSAMGLSVQPIRAVAPQQRYDAGSHNPFEQLGYTFNVERTGERVWHRQSRSGATRESLLDFRLEAHYAIGAGGRGRSYLTDRDGYLFQTAISWYSAKGIWDLSPGFDADLLPGRPVSGECLFCHANRAAPMPGYRNRLAEPAAAGRAIGCERCHGPGALHVREGSALVPIDPTIVNPRKLEPALREAVCQQCHLEGEGRVVRRGRRLDEYRPGLPLESVLSVFTHADDSGEKLVTHVEQMYLSRCFRGSAGSKQMGCISCHDPHRKIAATDRAVFYRQRCLQCHGETDCHAAPGARAARQDGCIDCHMPRAQVADITHVASTDHRIIRPGKAPPRSLGSGPLVAIVPRAAAVDDRELGRDRGIAEVETAELDRAGLERGLTLLERASSDFPDDWEAMAARGAALLHLHRPREAADVLRKVLAAQPRWETALAHCAEACAAAGTEADAIDAWRKAIELNPWIASYRGGLASLLIRRGAWQELEPQAAAWLRLDPDNAAAHKAWITALVRLGRTGEGRAALNRALALFPLNRGELEACMEDGGR